MKCIVIHKEVKRIVIRHRNPHGARGLSKHYHLCFDTKILHFICAICHILCACVLCTSMLDQPWIYGINLKKQTRYQPVKNSNYWQFLGSYNNWNIIHLSPKSTRFGAFEEINKVVLEGISDNMHSLV